MTIFEHPIWPTLRPFLYIRTGANGLNGPRHRIEVSKDAPPAVFAVHIACAHCGRDIVPVRVDARGAWTFNLSCPLSVDMRCARMPETTAMATAVRQSMVGVPPPPNLFT